MLWLSIIKKFRKVSTMKRLQKSQLVQHITPQKLNIRQPVNTRGHYSDDTWRAELDPVLATQLGRGTSNAIAGNKWLGGILKSMTQ